MALLMPTHVRDGRLCRRLQEILDELLRFLLGPQEVISRETRWLASTFR